MFKEVRLNRKKNNRKPEELPILVYDGSLGNRERKTKMKNEYRMTVKSIKRVVEREKDGTTYSWFVVPNNNRVSDSREFVNYDEGKTCVREYPAEWLPKSVQKFISRHERVQKDDFKSEEGFCRYIYE